MLLAIYLGCLIVGMGLLAASFFSDHDTDADVDHDFDVDQDVDLAPGEVAGSVDGAEALWLPILSMRFWVFFAAFFGLTGTILHFVHENPNIVLGVAAGMGFLCGYIASRLVRTLRAQQVNSTIDPQTDYVGKRGEVLLPIEPGDPGQVRLAVKGTFVDLPAVCEGSLVLARGAEVLVLEYRVEGGTLLVEPCGAGAGEQPTPQREIA